MRRKKIEAFIYECGPSQPIAAIIQPNDRERMYHRKHGEYGFNIQATMTVSLID